MSSCDFEEIRVEESADHAFAELLEDALARQAVHTSAATHRYLVSLLCRFLRTNLEQMNWALGVELLQSAELTPIKKKKKLKEIADTSLFLSGVFLDHAEAALPATDYFFAVGSQAYLNLGALSNHPTSPDGAPTATYQELGRRFEEFVCVLSTLGDRCLFPDNRHLLSVYSRWLDRGGSRDARRLIAAGFIPCPGAPGNRTQ